MENSGQFHFYHALKIDKETCIGCTHCMRTCPTMALRIENGKAELLPERCVDCGYCLKVCPVHAISVEQDDFQQIFNYKRRVALIPAILLGQFPSNINTQLLYSLLIEIGFTDVFETENSVELIHNITKQVLDNDEVKKPVISAFCPAIIRLIQVRFPELVNYIAPIKAPLQVSALYYNQLLLDEGVAKEDIGIFYITPCAAKIAEVKSYVHDTLITGVINMNLIYNKILLQESQSKKEQCSISNNSPFALNKRSILWTLTYGEADTYPGRCLAVDEIHNVIEFLEKIENEEIAPPDFLELRACDQSCAGGVLTIENRFLAVEKLKERADNAKYYPEIINEKQKQIYQYKDFLVDQSDLGKIYPNSMFKFAEDYKTAMSKYEEFKRLEKLLPKVDCGVCGSPSCSALAEDIVRGKKQITYCVFFQKALQNTHNMSIDESNEIFELIWGTNKIDKK